MNKIASIVALALFFAIASCTVTKNDQLDKNAQQFLADFRNALKKSDSEILSMFLSGQSDEELLKGIAVLQSKNTRSIASQILFEEAKGNWEAGYLLINLPVELIGEGEPKVVKHLTLKLTQKKNGKFYINRLGAEEVYTVYYSIKSKVEDRDRLAERLTDLKVYHDRALELQKDYDSVVWYVHHQDTTYYYATNGNYVLDSLNSTSRLCKMGLLHQNGKVIIPADFDLIGTPGITIPGAVEVRQQGKIGYYTMDGNVLIPLDYNWLVPYNEEGVVALVKKDSLFGWLDPSYQYHESFPSAKAEKHIRDFEYLTQNKFVFGSQYQTMIEMICATVDYTFRPNLLIVIPAFLSQNGIFQSVEHGFIRTDKKDNRYFEYGDEYVENQNEKPFSLSNAIDVFVSNFETKYVGGRGEFYTSHSISLVDKKNNVLSRIETHGDYDFKFYRLTDDLFESKFRTDNMGPDDLLEQNFLDYNYFRFDGKNLSELKSNRRFKFTEFIKIDSSYLSGNFKTYNFENGGEGNSNFLSKETLTFLRNEILADNGFIITDPNESQRFQNWDWYKPTIASYDDVYAKASEIDRHNLDFLSKILGLVVKPI